MLGKFSPIATRLDKNALVFFDRRNGTKLRFALGAYRKASKPELVDLKITDFCSFGCTFCYQNSGLEGKHASLENIDFIVKQLAKAKVFEVAIGGGETLEHPQIVEIITKFYEAGIVPNFTTKFPGKVRKFWPQLGHMVGGFAYSAETPAQIHAAAKLFKAGGIPSKKVNLHCVMGLTTREEFRAYLEAAEEEGYRVTLLGYKTVGRGKNIVPHPYAWWVEEVQDLINQERCPSLSIDTPLAAQYGSLLPVPTYTYHTQEGAVSMYIDCVALTFGTSSFEPKGKLRPFDENWRKVYRQKSFVS